MPRSAGALKKRRPVRQRPKKAIKKQKMVIHRGQKVSAQEASAIGRIPVGAGAGSVLAHWDHRKTTQENYEQIGFQLHPNKGINSAGPTKFDPEYAEYLEEKRAESIPEVPAKSSVIRAMEKATADVQKANEKVPKRMTFGEKDVVEALLAAHGTNWKKMASDLHLNRFQHTAGVLRRKCERYAKLYGLCLNEFAQPTGK